MLNTIIDELALAVPVDKQHRAPLIMPQVPQYFFAYAKYLL